MPIIIVEDGTAKTDSNSYVSEAEALLYHSNMGNSEWASATDEQRQVALIRGTKALDGNYRARWKGVQYDYPNQALEFPRSGIVVKGVSLGVNVIPENLKEACCECALRELASKGSMTPDLQRGGEVKKVKADTVSIEFESGASTTTTFTAIDNLLEHLVEGMGGNSPYSSDMELA